MNLTEKLKLICQIHSGYTELNGEASFQLLRTRFKQSVKECIYVASILHTITHLIV